MRGSTQATTDQFRIAKTGYAAGAGATVSRLADAIGAALDGPAADRSGCIISALRFAAANPDLLAPEHMLVGTDTYARHILHADPDRRFTVLALVWGPGQFSPVHAHHTWCAYAVRSGVLTETVYTFDKGTSVAVPLSTQQRRAGHGCHGEAGLDQIHRLGNAGGEPAISIHVYGVDTAYVKTAVNRVLAP